MRVLVACEESQAVCKAFREKGHVAYSCDTEPCSGGHPEWHIQADVLEVLTGEWDLMIAHPPCTYLSNAGARFLYPKKILNEDRLKKGIIARDLFMRLWNAPIKKICIENPLPSSVFCLPQHSQVIQPYEYGHPFKKRTQLWLKEIDPLKPTNIVKTAQSTKVAGNWFNKGGKDRQMNRAKTFQGIADAMANQYGGDIRDGEIDGITSWR